MEYEVKAEALERAFDAADLPRTPVERPAIAAAQGYDPAKSAFLDGYVRRGDEMELKSVTGATPQDGGFAVPREIDAHIGRLLKIASPIRQIANVVKVGTAGYRKLVTQNGVISGWVAENAARPETASPQFNEVVPSFGELYANPAATQAMLDDVAFDAEAWLADEIAAEFAKAEGAAFVLGNGTNRPKGFLAAPVAATADGARPFGTLQFLATGAAGAFAANPQDRLVDLAHSLKAPYRQGAVWVMNATTLAAIRKFKTTDGNFLFQPGLIAGQPNMLLGYPIIEAAEMPDIAANSLSIAFGNFKIGYPTCERLLLVYLPSVVDAAAPELVRANLPAGWRSPAFDILQLEDYDWVTRGAMADQARGRAIAQSRLGYPVARQHYLAGFVLAPEDRAQWAAIDAAATAARARGVAAIFFWALPQILRDGLTCFWLGEEGVDAVDDVDFPLALGRAAQVITGFATHIVTSASGHEQRTAGWANARLRFDAGPGLRSAADVAALVAFFRARRGAAKAFRFRDPIDHSSRAMTAPPTPADVRLGTGDGATTRFALVKLYGDGADAEVRRITQPVAESVRIAINGSPQMRGWSVAPGGWIDFAAAPAPGAVVTAGFLFDVLVRFENDQLEVTALLSAGEIASVPLIEVRAP